MNRKTICLHTVVCVFLSLIGLASQCLAQDAPCDWQSIAGGLFDAHGIGCDRYAIGVDRSSGKLFVDCGSGVWASEDQGKTFTRLGLATAPPATAAGAKSLWSLWISGDGRRLAAFNSHAGNKAASGLSVDGGKTWTSFDGNWIWGVMGSENESLLAIPDSGKSVCFSADGGKKWTDLKCADVCGIGIFGAGELVISRNDGKIRRSDDAGATWKDVVGNYACSGPLQVINGIGCWLARKGDAKGKECCLLSSKDKGVSWQELGALPSLFTGTPLFGKSEKEIVVATLTGIVASSDGGTTWQSLAGYPPYMPRSEYGRLTRAGRPVLNRWELADRQIAYDALHGVLYMGALTWEGPQAYLKLNLKEDATAPASAAATVAPAKGGWIDLTATCNEQIKSSNTTHSGTAVVHLRNLAVDRANGNLFVGDGPIAMSSDGGKTFATVNDDPKAASYFGWGGWGLQADPGGSKILSGGMDDKARSIVYCLDGGKTWQKLSTPMETHGMWAAVNFDCNTILVVASDGKTPRMISGDLGKTWTPLEKDRAIIGAGIFSEKQWVQSIPTGTRGPCQLGHLERTADGGKTWIKVADYAPLGPMKLFKGVGYWTAQKDDQHWVVISSKDQGQTWQEMGRPFDEDSYVNYGPMFGKNENQLFVMTWLGILETTDAGANWKMAARFGGDGPKCDAGNLHGYLFGACLPSVDYDPVHDAFYFANGGNVWLAGSGTIWKYQR